MEFGGYRLDILIPGYPGKTRRHGGLGWSTVALLRGHGRVAVVDTGGFGMRGAILAALDRLGVAPAAVTDLLLTHLHYDHMINWPVVPGCPHRRGRPGTGLGARPAVRRPAGAGAVCPRARGTSEAGPRRRRGRGAAGRGRPLGAGPHAGPPDVPGGRAQRRPAGRPAAGAGRGQVSRRAAAARSRHDVRPPPSPAPASTASGSSGSAGPAPCWCPATTSPWCCGTGCRCA